MEVESKDRIHRRSTLWLRRTLWSCSDTSQIRLNATSIPDYRTFQVRRLASADD
jgi:hypothetical protein